MEAGRQRSKQIERQTDVINYKRQHHENFKKLMEKNGNEYICIKPHNRELRRRIYDRLGKTRRIDGGKTTRGRVASRRSSFHTLPRLLSLALSKSNWNSVPLYEQPFSRMRCKLFTRAISACPPSCSATSLTTCQHTNSRQQHVSCHFNTYAH